MLLRVFLKFFSISFFNFKILVMFLIDVEVFIILVLFKFGRERKEESRKMVREL